MAAVVVLKSSSSSNAAALLLHRFGGGALKLFRYSTCSAPEASPPTHFLDKFLIDSLGFTREEATCAVKKQVPLTRSSKNPIDAVNFFRQTGLDNSQIKTFFSKCPRLLLFDVDKNLRPKVETLQALGLSGKTLVQFLTKNPTLFVLSLDSQLRPSIAYLTQFIGSNEDVVKFINGCKCSLLCNVPLSMAPNISYLRSIGYTDDEIKKLSFMEPDALAQKPERFKEMVRKVQEELGIPPKSGMFFVAFAAISSVSHSTLQKKIETYKSYGFSDSDIAALMKKHPQYIRMSEKTTRTRLEFYMRQHGMTPENLTACASLMSYSLERRVIPRIEAIKILEEKKLVKQNLSLSTLVMQSDIRFLEKFLLPNKDEVPDLYEAFVKKVKNH